jgi:hypothetical protein
MTKSKGSSGRWDFAFFKLCDLIGFVTIFHFTGKSQRNSTYACVPGMAQS